jgi:hypothetical protein
VPWSRSDGFGTRHLDYRQRYLDYRQRRKGRYGWSRHPRGIRNGVKEPFAADRLQDLDQQGGQEPFRRDPPRPVIPQIASDCGGRPRSAMPMIERMAGADDLRGPLVGGQVAAKMAADERHGARTPGWGSAREEYLINPSSISNSPTIQQAAVYDGLAGRSQSTQLRLRSLAPQFRAA